jgi:hypothetical protein
MGKSKSMTRESRGRKTYSCDVLRALSQLSELIGIDRPPEAPAKVGPEISVFEGPKTGNSCLGTGFFRPPLANFGHILVCR